MPVDDINKVTFEVTVLILDVIVQFLFVCLISCNIYSDSLPLHFYTGAFSNADQSEKDFQRPTTCKPVQRCTKR